jgi:hypothetical protein
MAGTKTMIAAAVGAVWLCGESRADPEKATQPVHEETMEMLGLVEDNDGFANMRAGGSFESKIAGKALSGSVVAVYEVKGDWTQISDDSGQGRDLFVHSSRLKKLEGWNQTAGTAAKDGNAASVKSGRIEAKVTAVPFVEAEHKITRGKEIEDEKLVTQVDGHAIWGRDLSLPEKSLALALTVDGKPVTLPAEATHDLYEPNMETLAMLTKGKPGEHALVIMQNGYGAGTYFVVWAIAAGKYVGRAIITY